MTIIEIFELIGVIVFAITGVVTAIGKKLDIFGAAVLGLVTAVGGGVMRDIILGYLPPVIFRSPSYAFLALLTSVLTFIIALIVGKRIKDYYKTCINVINILDSIGLALFTISGVQQAASCGFGDNMFLSVFVGVLTGVGGGLLRDIMAGQVPTILKKRVYAVASLLGALVYQVLMENGLCNSTLALFIGIGVILGIRILAIIFRWNMPVIRELGEDQGDKD